MGRVGTLLILLLVLSAVWAQAPATRGVTYEWPVFRQQSRQVPEVMLVNGVAMVPLYRLVYLGFMPEFRRDRNEVILTGHDLVYRLTLGNRVAYVGTRRLQLPLAPRTIAFSPTGTGRTRVTLSYPYVPLRALARAAGWQVNYAGPDPEGHADRSRVLLVKHFPPDPPVVPFAQLTALRLTEPATRADGRIRVEQCFSVDASRTEEYARGSYVAVVPSTITNTGTAPVFTGNFARFVETRSGMIFGVEAMAQSGTQAAQVLQPGESTELTTPLYRIATNEPVTRVIYSDGISTFTWEVAVPAG